MNDKIPLSVIMENTKGKFIHAFNQVIEESKLPAYLVEGMLIELLSEVRNRKNMELISDINAMCNKDDSSEEA